MSNVPEQSKEAIRFGRACQSEPDCCGNGPSWNKIGGCKIEDLPDGELRIAVLDDLQGHDVYLIQSTHQPITDHLLELLLLADVHKVRLSGKKVSVNDVIGDVSGRDASIVDDLISTGGTNLSVLDALMDREGPTAGYRGRHPRAAGV